MYKSYKKIYRKSDSSALMQSPSSSQSSAQSTPSKIVPSNANRAFSEECKKMFSPLLINIFELRQMIDNYKTQLQSTDQVEKTFKLLQEVFAQLEQLQKDIEEALRWCNGLTIQISKGINEAKEALLLFNKEKI